MTTDNSRVGHTPGPWRVEREDDGYVVVGKPAWPCERFGKRGEWDVARVDTSGKDDKLNARLIAAAPDLLEALQHAVSVIEAHVPRDALGMEGNPQDGMWPLLDEYLHHMKAAIAKATGAA